LQSIIEDLTTKNKELESELKQAYKKEETKHQQITH